MRPTLRSLASSRVLAYALVAVATVQLLAVTRDYAILGMDSYPAIASGLLHGPGDVVAIFTSPAVPGRVPYAFHGFYRPITTISLGIDHALFGVEPRGYFVTQALLFGLSSLLLYELARRVIGAATIGPLLALVTFLLAPSHVETLAVVARRSELLCAIFGALALLIETSRLARDRRSSLLAGLFTFLAVISKTTGIALVPAVFVLVVSATSASIVQRLRAALLATLPHLGAVVVAFAVQIRLRRRVGGRRERASRRRPRARRRAARPRTASC
ncbi:MAG: glycosyltransferase family 39 protein [Thermodesulfobacteriota bacterium]